LRREQVAARTPAVDARGFCLILIFVEIFFL